MQLLGKMLGDPNKKELKLIQPLIDEINELEKDMQQLSDEELTAKTAEFRAQMALHFKGGLVLEDELLKPFREVLTAAEPLTEKCSDEQLRKALVEHRQEIEQKRDPEYTLRDHLSDTLSDCFEKSYGSLGPVLDELRVTHAMDLAEETQEWPDTASDPQAATLGLLQKAEPLLESIDDDILKEAFKKSWPRFESRAKRLPIWKKARTSAWSSCSAISCAACAPRSLLCGPKKSTNLFQR
jgi:preprotein translocase subunit SecA